MCESSAYYAMIHTQFLEKCEKYYRILAAVFGALRVNFDSI